MNSFGNANFLPKNTSTRQMKCKQYTKRPKMTTRKQKSSKTKKSGTKTNSRQLMAA